jgi:hypothetical protein
MKIGEIARKAGVRASAIRFYERAGVLPPASRQNGQRHFAAEAELQLAELNSPERQGSQSLKSSCCFTASGAVPQHRRDGDG